MPSLKEPQKSIPGGFTFYIPDTKWTPAPFSSLDSIVQQLIAHRKGRPDLVAKHGWSLDPTVVLQEVTQYQVAICVRNGWNEYLVGGSEGTAFFPPPTPPTLRQKAKRLVAGVSTLVSWMDDGEPIVTQELADKRATICAACPMNGKGGLEAYFTVPAQNAIRAKLERKRDMKIATPMDHLLGVCTACDCPLGLKVWLTLDSILKKMTPEIQAGLYEGCWIRKRDQQSA